MPNIFGLVNKGLTNPLTEDLQGSDFNILDINELHLNELHDQDGIGPIVVHESLNMTNNQISNMADPTQNKDAATKQYVDGLVGGSIPYDIYGAFTDETSAIASGLAPMVLPASRDFTLTSIRAFLTTAAGFPNYTISDFRINGTPITTPTCSFSGATSTTSNLVTLATPISVSQGDRFEVNCNTGGAATGLKVVFMGSV